MAKGRGLAALLGASTIALINAQGAAQDEESEVAFERGGIDEIVVTARKREENLQDTPIAITALSGAELERRNVQDVTDIALYAPNVDISTSPSGGGGGQNAQVTIRGVGQTDFLITTDPGVGIYLDGVYFGRSTGGVLDIVGLERAEVLRGPQGTLFGRNTIGGAISLTSERPGETFGGHGEVTVGNLNRVDARAAVDVPLAQNFLTRLTVLSRNADGFSDRLLTGEELGDQNSLTGRVTALWNPHQDVEVFLAGDYFRARENSAATTSVGPFDPTAPLVGLYNSFVSPGDPFTDPDTGDLFTTNATGPNRNDSDVYGVSATIDWALGDTIDLKSITAWRGQEVDFGRDGDNSPFTIRETDNQSEQQQFSQELQLIGNSFDDRLEWVIGAFYFDETAEDFNEVRLVDGLFGALEALPVPLPCLNPTTAPPPCANPTFFYGIAPGGPGNPSNIGLDLSFDADLEVENTSYAAFGHATFGLTDRLNLTFGLRYTEDEKTVDSFQRRVASGAIITDQVVSETFDNISPKLGIDFDVSEALLLYASYSEGFKAGGFNGRPLSPGELTSFDPEILDAYELGFKSDVSDWLRLNGAVFFNQYQDIQLTAAVPDETGNLIVTVDNAAEAEVFGVEVEAQLAPAPGFDIFASVGYLDAQYTEVGNAENITEDSEFVKAPAWQTSLLGRYTTPLSSWGQMTFQADWSWRDDVFNDVVNSPAVAQEAYHLVNASLFIEPVSEQWVASLFVRNATDEEYIVNGVDGGAFGISEAVVGRPREYGVSYRVRF
jgi:iron complex outermembrane receptor protein